MTLLTTAPPYLVDEIALVDVLALFLAIATVSTLWYTVKKIFPDEVNDLRFFLTFIIGVVPFVTFVYFGLAVINYDAIALRWDWPPVLPLNDLFPPVIAAAIAFYIGQTLWLWLDWRKLQNAAMKREGSR